jgi:hypothetical protein
MAVTYLGANKDGESELLPPRSALAWLPLFFFLMCQQRYFPGSRHAPAACVDEPRQVWLSIKQLSKLHGDFHITHSALAHR